MAPLPIQSTKDQRVTTVSCAVYGPPKIGKTRLAATCPAPLVICTEPGGMLSLNGHDVKFVSAITFEQVWECVTTIESAFEAGFRTLIIDSVSAVAERLLVKSKSTKTDPRQAYGEVSDKIRDLMGRFVALQRFHRVMVFQQDRIEDGEGEAKYGPALPGNKLSQSVPYLPDEIFRFGVKPGTNGALFLQTRPDHRYTAGDRSGRLAPEEPPHLGNIFDKIVGVSPQKEAK